MTGIGYGLCARLVHGKIEFTTLDESVAGLKRHAITELSRRTFHVIRRWRHQRTGFTPFQRQLRAADRIDDNAGAVRRILDRQSQFQLDPRIPETLPLHANEADLIVPLPRHIVNRTDVAVAW